MTAADLPAYPGRRPTDCPFDPPQEYADWRADAAPLRVLWNGEPVWLINRFEDIQAALTDPRVSADSDVPGFPGQQPGSPPQPPTFPRMDDPEHARLRRLLAPEFTGKRMAQLRPRIQELADGFVDQMLVKGPPADLMRDFAWPFSTMVMSLILGVPYADHEFFQRQGNTFAEESATAQEKSVAMAALVDYMSTMLALKAEEPADDLMTVQAKQVAAGEISSEVAAMNGFILLVAGHETTANMIGLGTLALLRNPEQLARIRGTGDPAVIGNAVEELLRYLTIARDVMLRVPIEDVTIGGQLVRAGEGMIMNLQSGNRDASAFGEPDRFDIDRNTRGHLAFGYGTHRCIGVSLARVELGVAYPTLLDRLPELRLAIPFDQITFRHEMIIYGVHGLPVTW